MRSGKDSSIREQISKTLGCSPESVTITRTETEDGQMLAEVVVADIRALTRQDVMRIVADAIEDHDG